MFISQLLKSGALNGDSSNDHSQGDSRATTPKSPLQVALDVEWTYAVRRLLERGARADSCAGGYQTLLEKAVNWSDDELFRLVLLQYRSAYPERNVNKEFPALMSLATQRKSKQFIKTLIDLHLDLDTMYNGQTPLVIAADAGDVQFCHWLIKNGAILNPLAIDMELLLCQDPSPLALAVRGCLLKAIATLLELGADANAMVCLDSG